MDDSKRRITLSSWALDEALASRGGIMHRGTALPEGPGAVLAYTTVPSLLSLMPLFPLKRCPRLEDKASGDSRYVARVVHPLRNRGGEEVLRRGQGVARGHRRSDRLIKIDGCSE